MRRQRKERAMRVLGGEVQEWWAIEFVEGANAAKWVELSSGCI